MTAAVEAPSQEGSVSCLDVDSLLLPIPGEDPAGDAYAYPRQLRSTLDDLRKHRGRESNGSEYSERSDWLEIAKLCQESLRKESKDIRIAGHLAEAMLKLHGFAGLGAVLMLLRRMIDECWERINPPLDNDPETRAAPLANILDDPDRGFCFPNTVRMVPLFGSGDDALGAYHWKRLRSKGDPASEEEAAKALKTTKPEQLQAISADLHLCLTELQALSAALDQQMGDQAPGMVYLSEALRECQGQVESELRKILPPDVIAPAAEDSANDDAGSPAANVSLEGGPTPQQILQVRAKAYLQLDAAADLLLQIEPHSPIPYLVKRAVSLGRLPFPQLAKEVLRQEALLSELTREFGLPPEA